MKTPNTLAQTNLVIENIICNNEADHTFFIGFCHDLVLLFYVVDDFAISSRALSLFNYSN